MFPIPQKKPESWQEALKFIGKCPICDKKYNTESAKLFSKKENINLVHIICDSCQSAMINMILIVGQGLSSVGMVTDLSFEDAKRIFEKKPITLDDAIMISELLQKEKILEEIIS